MPCQNFSHGLLNFLADCRCLLLRNCVTLDRFLNNVGLGSLLSGFVALGKLSVVCAVVGSHFFVILALGAFLVKIFAFVASLKALCTNEDTHK